MSLPVFVAPPFKDIGAGHTATRNPHYGSDFESCTSRGAAPRALSRMRLANVRQQHSKLECRSLSAKRMAVR